MTTPPQQFPPVDAAVLMSPSDLAEHLLEYLKSQPDGVPRLHQGNVFGRLAELGGREFGVACAEAWSWLERSGLLIHSVDVRDPGVFELSRQALALSGPTALADLRQAALLPREMLHPTVIEQSYGLFLLGKYDLAVFAAFKAVEMSVAERSGCAGQGTDLMRSAFNPKIGPLADMNAHFAERESVAHLFAGAFGSFRNPVGHRNVTYANALEPAALLSLASLLMRIVDDRASTNARSEA